MDVTGKDPDGIVSCDGQPTGTQQRPLCLSYITQSRTPS